MKRSHTALTILAIIVLAVGSFALGYFIQSTPNGTPDGSGSFSTPSETLDEETTNERTQTQDKQVRLSIKELSDPDRFDSRIARTAALVESLQNSNANQLLQLLSQSKSMQAGAWQTEVQNTIIQRLAMLDPIEALAEAGTFSESRQQSLIPIVYWEWSVSNLDQAVDHAQDFDDDLKKRVIESIVLSRTDLSTDQIRTIARNLAHEPIAIKLLREQSGLEAIKNPQRELKKFLDQNARSLDDLSELQSEMFKQLVIARLLRDGVDTFVEIEKSLPMSHTQKQGLMFSVGRDLGEINPELALQLAVNAGSVGFGGLADFTVRAWAKSDPLTALNAVSALEGPSARRMLQSRIMESWATRDPNELLDASRTMPEHLKVIGQEKALVVIARSSPQKALSFVGEIADKDVRDRIANGIASSWARLDSDAALQWIENDETLSSRDDLREAVVNTLARINPQLAIATALELPPDEFGRGLEASAIRTLILQDLDMAIELLPLARDNITKSEAYDSVMSALLHSRNDFRQAFDLFIQLVEDVGTPEKGLFTLVWNRPADLFQSLNELPTEELKKQAARYLLSDHERSDVLTDEQLDYLRKFEDSPRIERSPAIDEAFERLLETLD